jgi:rubrerythrin
MTTFISSRLAIAFSSLVLVGSAAAEADEGRTSADLLTTQQLAAGAITQTDHVTLQQHFLTIAAQNDAQAAKHAAMAQAERDNPNPGSHFPGSAALRAKHCDRLAESSRELAQGARAAASEHELMATAIAQGDHATQQRYFVTLAGTYDAEAARHADMAQGERKNANRGSHFPGNASLKAVKHCDQLSTSLQAAAKEARERAAEHARMANSN